MKINWELLQGIGYSIILFCIIIVMTILIISRFTPTNLCDSWCNQNHGTFYIMSDCDGDTIACSGWCEIPPNQTVYCRDIFNNITSMES